MAILLTNDDGFDALGIQELFLKLKNQADIKIVAPRKNCSGMSACISLKKDIYLESVDENYYIVDGTPADCSYLGLTSLYHGKISQVVSGINLGANLGNDVFYSGTVGAALSGRGLEFPPIAISVASYNPRDVNFIADLSSNLVLKIRSMRIDSNILININIPDITRSLFRGIKITKLNNIRPQSFPDLIKKNDRNLIYQIGPSSIPSDVPENTDVHAINNGFVSISFLDYSLTDNPTSVLPGLEIELNE
ncbi:MAG: 5'/3'-nucleotidase SurE [Gammaproteobacteria bacterium]